MLALLPTFDVVSGIVIDDLHVIYLGVTLTLLRLWLDKSNRTKPYFIDKVYSISLCIHCMIPGIYMYIPRSVGSGM